MLLLIWQIQDKHIAWDNVANLNIPRKVIKETQAYSAVRFFACWPAVPARSRQTACRHGCCCPDTSVWKDAPHRGWAELDTEHFFTRRPVLFSKGMPISGVMKIAVATWLLLTCDVSGRYYTDMLWAFFDSLVVTFFCEWLMRKLVFG